MGDAPERIFACYDPVFDATYWVGPNAVYLERHSVGEYIRADLAPTDAVVMANEKVRALVDACFAEIDARAMYLAAAPDRGGMHGPKGQRKQALDAAQLRTIAALRDLEAP